MRLRKISLSKKVLPREVILVCKSRELRGYLNETILSQAAEWIGGRCNDHPERE